MILFKQLPIVGGVDFSEIVFFLLSLFGCLLIHKENVLIFKKQTHQGVPIEIKQSRNNNEYCQVQSIIGNKT